MDENEKKIYICIYYLTCMSEKLVIVVMLTHESRCIEGTQYVL